MTQPPTEDDQGQVEPQQLPDEDMHLFVYGSLRIIDVETGTVLVNKSF